MIPTVERWRDLVARSVERIAVVEPWLVSPVKEVGLTSDALADVVLAIMQRESAGDPSAQGDTGCSLGLLQINVCIGREFPDLARITQDAAGNLLLTPVNMPVELYDPQTNVEAGIRIFLAELADLDDVEAAILGYNGHGAVRRWLSGKDSQPSNLPYLEAVLLILGVPFGYFADLKKKTS